MTKPFRFLRRCLPRRSFQLHREVFAESLERRLLLSASYSYSQFGLGPAGDNGGGYGNGVMDASGNIYTDTTGALRWAVEVCSNSPPVRPRPSL